MREIEFRGLVIGRPFKDGVPMTGKWVSGDLTHGIDGDPTIESREDGRDYLVDPETVGQYTGFEDRNGRRIYEGDLLRGDTFYGLARVMWLASRGKVALRLEDGFSQDFRDFDGKTAEVVGNVHDNPGMARGLK